MWYLCVFYHRLLDYRRPEVESLAELFGGPGAEDTVEWRMPENHHSDSPFHLVRLPGDERLAAQVANRSKLELSRSLPISHPSTLPIAVP
jgi:tRNA (guanine10-N2)-methyltransferase